MVSSYRNQNVLNYFHAYPVTFSSLSDTDPRKLLGPQTMVPRLPHYPLHVYILHLDLNKIGQDSRIITINFLDCSQLSRIWLPMWSEPSSDVRSPRNASPRAAAWVMICERAGFALIGRQVRVTIGPYGICYRDGWKLKRWKHGTVEYNKRHLWSAQPLNRSACCPRSAEIAKWPKEWHIDNLTMF